MRRFINIEIDLEEFAQDIGACLEEEDIFGFIKCLDLAVGDMPFTEELFCYFGSELKREYEVDGNKFDPENLIAAWDLNS